MNTSRITRESLEKSLELCDKSTPGPWTPFDSGPWGGQGAGIAIGDDVDMWPKFDKDTSKGVANSFFVAHHNPEFIKELVQAHLEALECLNHMAGVNCSSTCGDRPETTLARHYEDLAQEYLSKHGGVE